jgi:hypothetical protein
MKRSNNFGMDKNIIIIVVGLLVVLSLILVLKKPNNNVTTSQDIDKNKENISTELLQLINSEGKTNSDGATIEHVEVEFKEEDTTQANGTVVKKMREYGKITKSYNLLKDNRYKFGLTNGLSGKVYNLITDELPPEASFIYRIDVNVIRAKDQDFGSVPILTFMIDNNIRVDAGTARPIINTRTFTASEKAQNDETTRLINGGNRKLKLISNRTNPAGQYVDFNNDDGIRTKTLSAGLLMYEGQYVTDLEFSYTFYYHSG